MKKKSREKKSLKKQLISGLIYTALSAVVVAVTVNTTVGIISGRNNLSDMTERINDIKVEVPSIPTLPPVTIPEIDFTDSIPEGIVSDIDEQPVSDSPEGVDSLITENADIAVLPEAAANSQGVVDYHSIPEDAHLGFDTFVKPCDGYVSKEHSVDIPVYSSTMADYRTHTGVDVVCDMGSAVSVVSGGVVTEIYDDVMLGKTVCMQNRNGYTIKYSNLLPELYAGVEVGSILATGEHIGGIGESALCEAAEAPHVHLEIYDSDGNPVDPEDLIIF